MTLGLSAERRRVELDPRRRPRARKKIVHALPSSAQLVLLRATLANFFFFLNFASYFLLPLFLHDLGGSEALIGAVMGTAGLASLAVLPLVGMTIDRIGRACRSCSAAPSP